jgi:hypothetical protein
MTTKLSPETVTILRKAIAQPCLANSRELEAHLIAKGFQRKIFGRINQKSSIDAASESDRGITERLSNAFDASLTSARRLAGYAQSDSSFTPRNVAQRSLNPNRDDSSWELQYKNIEMNKQFIFLT